MSAYPGPGHSPAPAAAPPQTAAATAAAATAAGSTTAANRHLLPAAAAAAAGSDAAGEEVYMILALHSGIVSTGRPARYMHLSWEVLGWLRPAYQCIITSHRCRN